MKYHYVFFLTALLGIACIAVVVKRLYPTDDEAPVDKTTLVDSPMFHGNADHTGYYPGGISAGKSPKRDSAVVYFGASDHFLYALDAKTGKELWKFDCKKDAYNPPIISGSVFFANGDLYALAPETGELLWKMDGLTYSNPAYVGGILYCVASKKCSAIDAKTCTVLWETKVNLMLSTAPAIANGVMFVSSQNQVMALDCKTGEEKWRVEINGELNPRPPIPCGVYVLVASSSGNIYAMMDQTGEIAWKVDHREGNQAVPAAANDVVYYCADKCLRARKADTGELLWEEEVFTSRSSAPAVVDGVIYIGFRKNDYFGAFDAKTGERKWKFKTKDDVFSDPAAANGLVYFSTFDKKLYALDAKTGEVIWEFESNGANIYTPSVAD